MLVVMCVIYWYSQLLVLPSIDRFRNDGTQILTVSIQLSYAYWTVHHLDI